MKLRAKTLRSVALLERYGPELGEPESKRVGENLYELRSTFASDTGRVMYFFMAGKTAVLTNGFLKKSRRLPGRERERAERYRLDYMRRFGND